MAAHEVTADNVANHVKDISWASIEEYRNQPDLHSDSEDEDEDEAGTATLIPDPKIQQYLLDKAARNNGPMSEAASDADSVAGSVQGNSKPGIGVHSKDDFMMVWPKDDDAYQEKFNDLKSNRTKTAHFLGFSSLSAMKEFFKEPVVSHLLSKIPSTKRQQSKSLAKVFGMVRDNQWHSTLSDEQISELNPPERQEAVYLWKIGMHMKARDQPLFEKKVRDEDLEKSLVLLRAAWKHTQTKSYIREEMRKQVIAEKKLQAKRIADKHLRESGGGKHSKKAKGKKPINPTTTTDDDSTGISGTDRGRRNRTRSRSPTRAESTANEVSRDRSPLTRIHDDQPTSTAETSSNPATPTRPTPSNKKQKQLRYLTHDATKEISPAQQKHLADEIELNPKKLFKDILDKANKENYHDKTFKPALEFIAEHDKTAEGKKINRQYRRINEMLWQSGNHFLLDFKEENKVIPNLNHLKEYHDLRATIELEGCPLPLNQTVVDENTDEYNARDPNIVTEAAIEEETALEAQRQAEENDDERQHTEDKPEKPDIPNQIGIPAPSKDEQDAKDLLRTGGNSTRFQRDDYAQALRALGMEIEGGRNMPGSDVELRWWQTVGIFAVLKMLEHDAEDALRRLGVLIADQVGLGKTFIMAGIMLHVRTPMGLFTETPKIPPLRPHN